MKALALSLVCALVLLGAKWLLGPWMTQAQHQANVRATVGFIDPALYNSAPVAYPLPPAHNAQLNNHSQAPVYLTYLDRQLSAVIVPVTAQGYEGPIALRVAFTPAGVILGVHVLSHSETPKIGDRVLPEYSAWLQGFSGQDPLQTSFDQLAGATKTSAAITRAVTQARLYVQAAQWPVFYVP